MKCWYLFLSSCRVAFLTRLFFIDCFQPFVADKFQGPNFMESWYSFLEEGGGGVDSNRLPRNCSDSSPQMPNSIREHEISWESLYLYYKISRSSQKIDGRVLVASHQEDDARTNFREAERRLEVASVCWERIVATNSCSPMYIQNILSSHSCLDSLSALQSRAASLQSQ